jgi:hypothetical protein
MSDTETQEVTDQVEAAEGEAAADAVPGFDGNAGDDGGARILIFVLAAMWRRTRRPGR